jgi:hypothetical protein
VSQGIGELIDKSTTAGIGYGQQHLVEPVVHDPGTLSMDEKWVPFGGLRVPAPDGAAGFPGSDDRHGDTGGHTQC